MRLYLLVFHLLFCYQCTAYDQFIPNNDSEWIKTNHSSDAVRLRNKLRENPKDNTLLLQLIHKYIKMNRIVKAKHFLKMAKNRRINSYYLLLLEGMILNREDRVNPSARKLLYSALLKSEQTQAIYYIEYLECLFREKRLKKGIYWNRLAMKLFPRNLVLMQMYARFWFYSGHIKEAETTLLRVFEHNDGLPSVNFNLSLVYAKLRQHDACIRYLKLAAFAGFSKKDLLTLNEEFNFVHDHPQFLLALDKILLNYVDFQQKYRFKKI